MREAFAERMLDGSLSAHTSGSEQASGSIGSEVGSESLKELYTKNLYVGISREFHK
jgi:hypothetical protein